MVVELVVEPVSLASKVTLLVDFTCIALPVFKMDVGVLVDKVDMDESDDPAAVTVDGGARFQVCIFGSL